MNRQTLVAQLHSDYMIKRKHAQFFAEQKKQRALSNKEYLTLEILERNLVLDLAKQAFEQKDTAELSKQLAEIVKTKKQVLAGLKLSPADLLPKYECETCADTGIVNNTYCNCFKQALNQKLMDASEINLQDLPTLSNYDYSIFSGEQKQQVQKILDVFQKFASNFEQNKIKTILLCGKTGVGKTYLTKVLAKEVISRGHTAYYTTAFNLNNLMAKYHTTFDAAKNDLLNSVLESDLLVIDDLGIEPILKNVTLEYLLLIVSERLQNNKSTIINTNLAPTHIIDRYGERIFSRLMNKQTSLLINMEGIDLRLKKQV